ncbi:MAG: hypothetical protein LC770_13030, partial [Acidobacteria bacterium]|nr:hypothetical protein [Acidobacteriota bacterium]
VMVSGFGVRIKRGRVVSRMDQKLHPHEQSRVRVRNAERVAWRCAERAFRSVGPIVRQPAGAA